MIGGLSKAVFILATLPALALGHFLPFELPIDLPRHPVVVSKLFGLPMKVFKDSFIKKDLPKNYQKLSAIEKQDLLWELITKDPTRAEWVPTDLLGVWFRNQNDMFDHASDERPWRGSKAIHQVGSICKARFDANPNTPYTGLWKGCKTMFVRLAPGSNPNDAPGGDNLKKNMLSGISAKFLIDGEPARNYLSFRRNSSLTPLDYPNEDPAGKKWQHWFDGDQSNIPKPIPFPINLLLLPKFTTASNEPNHMGMAEIGNVDPQGNKIEDPVFPFEVRMRPNKALKHILYDDLDTIPAGTKLYDVYAKKDGLLSPLEKIGSITSTSKMTNSKWADLRMWFQHHRRDTDLKMKGLRCPYMPARKQTDEDFAALDY